MAGSIMIGFGLWFLSAYLSFLISAGTYAYQAVQRSIAAIFRDPAARVLSTSGHLEPEPSAHSFQEYLYYEQLSHSGEDPKANNKH